MSSNNLTLKINNNNIKNIQNMIKKKIGVKPFYTTTENVESIITDIDHTPYTRFYRGNYLSENPIVFEREAGYRVLHNNCYSTFLPAPNYNKTNTVCFESACSTVYPCIEDIPNSRNQLMERINKNCFAQYY